MLKIIKHIDLPDELGYVELIDSSKANLNQEEREKFVTSIAAISRGKDKSVNPKKRFEHLLKEGAPNLIEEAKEGRKLASRALEFCPVKLDANRITIPRLEDVPIYHNNFFRFCYITEDESVCTNFRAVYNSGLFYEVPFNTEEEVKDFKVIKIKAPHFVFDQLYTHTMLSKIAVSERVVEETDYWLPTDIFDRMRRLIEKDWKGDIKLSVDYYDLCNTYYDNPDIEDLKNILFHNYSTNDVYNFLKELGYSKEIYQRFHYGLKYKVWFMAGWINDPMTWQHLCLQRSAFPELYKDWTQEQTRKVVEGIKQLLFTEK